MKRVKANNSALTREYVSLRGLVTGKSVNHKKQKQLDAISLTDSLQQTLMSRLPTLAGVDINLVVMEYNPENGSHRYDGVFNSTLVKFILLVSLINIQKKFAQTPLPSSVLGLYYTTT